MKLNLGCGFDKRDGWLNVDSFAECQPDQLLDIEQTPWDLPTDGFEHVLLKHVLEHVGADFKVFAAVMRELYRVTAPGGLLEIHVPHVRHDSFWSDPTHVRAFTGLTFQMMSKRQNRAWMEARANYTMLAFVMDVDFELVEVVHVFDRSVINEMNSGALTLEAARIRGDREWNAIREIRVKMTPVKP